MNCYIVCIKSLSFAFSVIKGDYNSEFRKYIQLYIDIDIDIGIGIGIDIDTCICVCACMCDWRNQNYTCSLQLIFVEPL